MDRVCFQPRIFGKWGEKIFLDYNKHLAILKYVSIERKRNEERENNNENKIKNGTR